LAGRELRDELNAPKSGFPCFTVQLPVRPVESGEDAAAQRMPTSDVGSFRLTGRHFGTKLVKIRLLRMKETKAKWTKGGH
jgi:hypothetical protein